MTARAYADLGDIDTALDVYRKHIEAGDYQLRFAFANFLDRHRRYDEALQVLDEYEPGAPSGTVAALRGSILLGLERGEEADESFRHAKNEIGRPRTATATERSWLAYVAKQLGDIDLLRDVEAVEKTSERVDAGALPELMTGK